MSDANSNKNKIRRFKAISLLIKVNTRPPRLKSIVGQKSADFRPGFSLFERVLRAENEVKVYA